VSHRLDHGHLDDSEREWLRASRRTAARKSWLLVGGLVVAAIFFVWVTWWAVPRIFGDETPATTTPEQRVIADGEKALTDWGEFAVTNDLGDVKDSFWANGPQYRLLAQQMTRPGEEPQTFNWDLLLKADPATGGRWRLWTVSKTA
jgi:hypothetical protein